MNNDKSPRFKSKYSRNSFHYNTRVFLNGKKNYLTTPKLNLERYLEINLNKTRCDFIFKAHLFAHNYTGVLDPSCSCGHRSQTSRHLFLNCPLLTDLRRKLLSDLGELPNFDYIFSCLNVDGKLWVLLHGSADLPLAVNKLLIRIVAQFISNAKEILPT